MSLISLLALTYLISAAVTSGNHRVVAIVGVAPFAFLLFAAIYGGYKRRQIESED